MYHYINETPFLIRVAGVNEVEVLDSYAVCFSYPKILAIGANYSWISHMKRASKGKGGGRLTGRVPGKELCKGNAEFGFNGCA